MISRRTTDVGVQFEFWTFIKKCISYQSRLHSIRTAANIVLARPIVRADAIECMARARASLLSPVIESQSRGALAVHEIFFRVASSNRARSRTAEFRCPKSLVDLKMFIIYFILGSFGLHTRCSWSCETGHIRDRRMFVCERWLACPGSGCLCSRNFIATFGISYF